jgi:serine/threonine protein kinase
VRLIPGTRVGPYEVVALLGVGGMAEVYRAKDPRLGREVAIKVVSEALGADGAFLERFEREAKLAASLAHPNVVALHDVGFHDGKPYFVTELLLGETLRERLAKGFVPLTTALEWAAQMAQGLAAAHERGIVHRDLKPENVFITRDGKVKLLDFGIAKLVEAAHEATPHSLMDETASPSGSRTGTGMVLGTPGYMSPEQVRGDPIDTRTDFFSLGVVLYEMLTRHRAFPGDTAVEAGYAILHSEPEPIPSNIPPLVGQVVNRCLEKDPARRFQSARDLAFNLELLRTPTGAATPAKDGPGVGTLTSRRRRWLLPLAGLLPALAIAGGSYLVGRDSRPSVASVKQLTFRLGRVSASRFTFDGRVIFSAAWGGEPLDIFSQTAGNPEGQALGIRDANLLAVSTTGDLAVLLNTNGADRASWRGTLALVPGTGGTPREVAENVGYADFSQTGELAVVRAVGAERRLEYPIGTVLFEADGRITNPRVSPNGDSVAFFHMPRSGPAELVVVNRKRQRQTLEKGSDVTGLAWVPSGEAVWFSTENAIWASPLARAPHLVYQGVSEMALEDISQNGSVLVNARATRSELAFLPSQDPQHQRALSWLDWTELVALSDDGSRVLFTSFPGRVSFSFTRPTDGSPGVRLGEGDALDFSPDGKSVLVTPRGRRDEFEVVPVGAGESKTVPLAGATAIRARWLSDGKRIVFVGAQSTDKQYRLYVVGLDGGPPAQVSGAGIRCCFFEVSRDDRLVAARNLDDILTLYPLGGGPPLALPELSKNVVPVGWNRDGQIWVRQLREVPARILLYDIGKRRVLAERTFSPNDPTGVSAIGQIQITPDSMAIAYTYIRTLGDLYLLDGLSPPRR